MISLQEGQNIVFRKAVRLAPVTLSLEEACGTILAEDIRAREDHPLFNSSAVDGFAVRTADLPPRADDFPVSFELDRTIHAGDSAGHTIKSGRATRIMTGAPVPLGTDAVVMKENVHENGNLVILNGQVRQGENIRYRGEELLTGTPALHKGDCVTPSRSALLAILGYDRVAVIRKPAVAVITTGNELRPPGHPLTPGTVRDANTYFLSSALRETGITNMDIRSCVPDKPVVLQQVISECTEESDVVIVTGGVSVGDHDHVKDTFGVCGVEKHFWRMNIKPGKPVFFGTLDNKLVFGLPGNPVAVAVLFYELVRPVIRKMSGHEEYMPLRLSVLLQETIKKRTRRLELVRGSLSMSETGITVSPAAKQGSHMMSGIAGADCLIHFPENMYELSHGSVVRVDVIDEDRALQVMNNERVRTSQYTV